MMHRVLATILLLLAGCNRAPAEEAPSAPAAAGPTGAPVEGSDDGRTDDPRERASEHRPVDAPGRGVERSAPPDAEALDAFFGERGCRHLIGKLQGPWFVGSAEEPELWDVSEARVQIERGDLREMRMLVAHSALVLEVRDAAADSSRSFVLAQDEHALHFGEGAGGMKTALGYIVATDEHHLVVTTDRCTAYEVSECTWAESEARYTCALDEAAESLTIRRHGGDGETLTLQLGSGGVAVDHSLRRSTLRPRR